MQQNFTLRFIMVVLLALIAHQYHSCKKIDLERQVLIRTLSAEEVTPFSASLKADIIDAGEADDVTGYGFVFATNANPTINDRSVEKGTSMVTGTFESVVDALLNNTTYYFRGYASMAGGEVYYGNEQSFKTLPGNVTTPTVMTVQVSNITQTEATISGNITDNGGAPVTRRGFCIGTSPNPTISGPSSDNGSGAGQFNHTFAGLDENTTYHVRAYAENSVGVAYGQDLQFTTGSGGGPINEWLHYDDGVNYDGIGLIDGGSFDVAIRFTPQQLQPYIGCQITRVVLFPKVGAPVEYTIEIMEGQNPTLDDIVYEQYVEFPLIDQWNFIQLNQPYLIDGSVELWVGYYIENQEADTYPAGVDDGPGETGFGDLISLDNMDTWNTLSEIGINANWNLQIFVTNQAGEEILMQREPGPNKERNVSSGSGSKVISSKILQQTTQK